MADPAVVVEIAAPVARIRLDRSAKRNAITAAMLAAFADALTTIKRRTDVRVVVVSGNGTAFTAGNDLADMASNPDTGPASPPSRFLQALVDLPQVLVAEVDGPAIGIGTTLLLHADLVYATERSFFALPFVKLGLVPEAASTYLLPELVGHQVAAELMLLGRRFSAAEAHSWRLVNEVLADRSALAGRVNEVVAELVAAPADALRATRRLLREHRDAPVRARLVDDAALLRELAAAAAAAEG